jgi:hypothetical protein
MFVYFRPNTGFSFTIKKEEKIKLKYDLCERIFLLLIILSQLVYKTMRIIIKKISTDFLYYFLLLYSL